MGTGKTYALKEYLNDPNNDLIDSYIIALSFRKSFASDFASKMGFIDY